MQQTNDAFTGGQFWPSGIVVACVCMCVHVFVCVCHSLACPRDNSGPVQARITKFGPKMQKTLVKVPIVLGGQLTLTFKVKFNLPHFELVRTITHCPFKLGSPNLDLKCKIAWLRSLLFWVAIGRDLQGQIWLKKWNFLVSPLLGIHNHHITTREPWVPRLLHRPVSWSPSSALTYIPRLSHDPDCFTISTCCTYTDLGSRRYFGIYHPLVHPCIIASLCGFKLWRHMATDLCQH